MKKRLLGLLVVLFLSVTLQAWAADENLVKIQQGKKEYMMGFIEGNKVKLQNLEKIFNFKYQSGSDTGFIRINGTRYTDGLQFRMGAYFVPVEKFLKFFLVDFEKKDNLTYIVKNAGMLNLNSVNKTYMDVSPGTLPARKMSTIALNEYIFIDARDFSAYTGKKIKINPAAGTATYGGNPVSRWFKLDGREFFYLKDLENATAQSILLARPMSQGEERKEEQAQKRVQQIKDNIIARYEGDKQFDRMIPSHPIAYAVAVYVSNGFTETIQINPDDFVLVGKDGSKYSGEIAGSTAQNNVNAFETLSNDTIINGTTLSYFSIVGRDSAVVVFTVVPPKDFKPDYFTFSFGGVELVRRSIEKKIIPMSQ